ncbi:MAG: class I SAM-dependent methyltransferase, partial [Cyclobacteriaceae bacterium]
MQINEQIRNFYNQHVNDEDQRLQYHAFELPVTLHYIKKYLKPGAKILDVSSGTGRYGQNLLNLGYKVAFNDLAEKNIQLVKERLQDHENFLAAETNEALATNLWSKENWDAILILGPLYHYISNQKRVAILNKAREHCKKNGYIFSAFMSRIGALVFGMKHNPDGIFSPRGAYHLWEKGFDENFVESTETFAGAHVYFSNPDEIIPLIESAGLKSLHLAGIEGLFGERFAEYHQMTDDQKKAWLDLVIQFAEDKPMVYNSKH